MRRRITAAEAAILIVVNLQRKQKGQKKTLVRARISERTLRKITDRVRLDGRFVEELGYELLELDWLLIRTKTAWGFMRADAVMSWARINAERISDELDRIGDGELDEVITEIQDELEVSQSDDDEADEEEEQED